ncbi:MAG: hypothetical protein A2751_05125 [Candidatus Doudnabacteria bacterium RIFCSPHIGHO2_01_FULL_46_14]|uniref:DUF11 domain-containing protein n=1 Tax=Candidatus Doudnabacteria bacterium RIFCSPHIGHO2_01_FULL_46_14 TaxID=1817824 RepID=A0A1F5NP33_9BACT|nr:MAG: hypothetical protein A2751_05125 [Candidatus Doudnabacteria bacterium RIFCSPHIGHO2_01_FULL_46_14]
MFFKLATAILVISAVIILPNFDGAGAQDATQPLTVETKVRNLSRGENIFQDQINAQPGDRVQIRVRVNAGTAQTGIIVRNGLPARLAFSSGDSGLNNAGGFAAGNMNGGSNQTFTYEAIVTGNEQATIVNTVYVRSNESSERSDSAEIIVTDVAAPAQIQNLVVRNRVMNLTRGETEFQNATSASVGDRLRYEVYIETLGNASQSGVTLRYLIPYGRFVIVSGDPNFILYGLDIASMRPNTSQTVVFEVTLNSGDSDTLNSIARVFSGTVPVKDATATVFVRGGSTFAVKNLVIDAKVMNLSRGEASFKDTTAASAGEKVRFQIKIDALGNAPITNVVLRNPLSSRLSFMGGDLNVTNSSGLGLGTMTGTSKTVMFDAQVGSGVETITNTAIVSGDGVSNASDSAMVTISEVAGTTTAAGQKSVIAVNRSAGQDASKVIARPGDVVAYQFTYRNTSNAAETVRIETDIRDIMELARVSNTGGAVVDNGVIRFPAVSLAPKGEIIQSFEVTVLSASAMGAAQDRIMTVSYGNTSLVQVGASQVAGTSTIQPPRTGASENLVVLLAVLATAGYWFYRRKSRLQLA